MQDLHFCCHTWLAPSPASSLHVSAGDVKEPTQFLQKVANIAPGIVV